jgi:anti-anti-sigma factor
MLNIEQKDRLIIRLSGYLDATNSDEAAEKVKAALEGLDRDVLIDVEELEYISSAGLQVVLYAAKAANAIGKQSYLKGAGGNVLEIFKLSGFLTFLKLI